MIIETNRGHNLGRIIEEGSATTNTGIPGSIGGYTAERVLRAPTDGRFSTHHQVGDLVKKGDTVGHVANTAVIAELSGILRGLIRPGFSVSKGLKLGDIDPRGDREYCDTISDKARAISGSALECVLRRYNRWN